MEELDELYQEIILDHHRHPRCAGTLKKPTESRRVFNPLCGDEVTVEVKLSDGVVQDVAFHGHGCSISQASASMMGELCKGKTVAEVERMRDLFLKMVQEDSDNISFEELGDASVLSGVKEFPARIRCAVIAWEALAECVAKAAESQTQDS